MSRFKCYSPKCYAVIAVFLCLLSSAENKRHVKIRNFVCENFDEKFGNFLQCVVKPIKRDVSEVNVQYKLEITVNEGLMYNLFMKKRGNVRSPLLYNITIDGCKFLRDRKKNRLANMFYKVMGFEEYSNLNHTCPYEEQVIYLKGYRMEEKIISYLPIPYGEYVLGLHWFYNNSLVAKIEVPLVFYDENTKPLL